MTTESEVDKARSKYDKTIELFLKERNWTEEDHDWAKGASHMLNQEEAFWQETNKE